MLLVHVVVVERRFGRAHHLGGGVGTHVREAQVALLANGRSDTRHRRYAAFGYVVDGFDVLEELTADDGIVKAKVMEGASPLQPHG